MKTLYLTSEQASNLATDLKEYSDMLDSSDREVFEGFKISFGDPMAADLYKDEGFEVVPISNYLLIEAEK